MPDLEERIALAKDLKRFAVEELGIAPNPSFEEAGEVTCFYRIYGSRRDDIVPAIGLPYGCEDFQDPVEWRRRIKDLNQQDIDVFAAKLEALGFETCPLTQSALKATKTRLAYIILHENAHIHCRINGFSLPFNFEEPLADCFAYQGALLYFRAHSTGMVPHIEKDFHNFWLAFYDTINRFTPLLEQAYKAGVAEGRAVLKEAQEALKPFIKKKKGKPQREVNNAVFLLYREYSTFARAVWERLRETQPKEYMQNKDTLYQLLADILPQRQNNL